MNAPRDKNIFWWLFAAQAAGAQVVLWVGLPLYRSLLGASPRRAGTFELGLVIAAVVIMQLAYWFAYSLQPRLRFRRNIALGHVLYWFGELCFFFPSALAAVILFDRFEELDLVPWNLGVLAWILFSMFCYKRQLETLGERMLATEATRENHPSSKVKADEAV